MQQPWRRFGGRGLGPLALTVALAVMTGCGDGDDNGSGSGNTGRLQVAITDQAGTYSQVVLSIREVRLVPAGQENVDNPPVLPVVVSSNPARVVDITSLRFQAQILGDAVVPAGTYQQLRLVLEENPSNGLPVNYVIRANSTERVALRTPSGQESGLKVNGRFTVTPGVLNAIVIDFDPDSAIVEAGNSGNLNLKPTAIRIVQVESVATSYGTLSATVGPSAAIPNTVVYVYPSGSTTPIASGLVDPETGAFTAFLPAGTYYVRATSTGFVTFDSSLLSPPVFYTVNVGQNTTASAIVLVP